MSLRASPSLRVLIVEDEASDRLLLEEAVRARGHTPVTCPDGESGWEAFQEDTFAMVLLDLALPGIDGLELCRRIRGGSRGQAVIILVVTGVSEPGLLSRVLEAGANDYLGKPVDPALLDVRLAVAERKVHAQWERLLAGEQLAVRNEELSSLYRITEMVLRAGSEASAYETILEEVGEATGFPLVMVEIYEVDRARMVVKAARGLDLPEGGALSIPVGDTLSGVAVRTGRPVLETDAGRRPEHAANELRRLGLRTYLSFPMYAGAAVVGTLTLGHTEAIVPDKRLVRWAGSLANSVASFVERTSVQEAMRESEQRFRKLAGQLQRANRELEAFAYSVSHDLRAPLRTMQGFAHALLQNFGHELDPEARDYAERIIRSGRQSETLISDLLAYSRLTYEDVLVGPVDLDSVVADAREQLSADLAHARVRVESPLPTVAGQRATLVTVVSNLLSNAVKFVPEDRTPEVVVRGEETSVGSRLWVEDNGVGIPADKRERVFGVFERLVSEGPARPGTGIGLAVVRRGMERLGGRAGLEGREPGSAFWLEFPRAEP